MLRKKKLLGGIPTPLKNDEVRVSWDDDSQLNGKIEFMFQTTNQETCLDYYISVDRD